MTTYQKIQTFVKQANPSLGKLIQQFQTEQNILHFIQAQLSATQAKHCVAISVRKDKLVVFCDSPSLTSKLRYLGPQLLPKLQRKFGLGVLEMSCKTHSATSGKPPSKNLDQVMRLPPQAAREMSEMAEAIDDPSLSAALRRLSRHSK